MTNISQLYFIVNFMTSCFQNQPKEGLKVVILPNTTLITPLCPLYIQKMLVRAPAPSYCAPLSLSLSLHLQVFLFFFKTLTFSKHYCRSYILQLLQSQILNPFKPRNHMEPPFFPLVATSSIAQRRSFFFFYWWVWILKNIPLKFLSLVGLPNPSFIFPSGDKNALVTP